MGTLLLCLILVWILSIYTDMKLINIGWLIGFIGLGMIMYSLFIIGDVNGDGRLNDTVIMSLSIYPLGLGGLIILYFRWTDNDDGEW